jgi:membrane protease YdiL (CAAX protease family)
MLFEKIQFEPDENVLKTVRKHWFVIVTELAITLILLLAPFFILFIIALFPSQLLLIDTSLGEYTGLIAFFLSGWSLLTLMVGFATWTHYYLDVWIITDRRIILIDQVGFFNRNVSIFRLERLQDIEFYIKGVIPTILNFGTLRAQTASAFESNFKTSGLPDPRDLQALIQKATDDRLVALNKPPIV